MPNCVNDWTPIITAIGVQIPILAGLVVIWLNVRISQAKSKSGHEVTTAKLDALTTITVNGFHSPPITPEKSDELSSS